jgi:hypothetical protein
LVHLFAEQAPDLSSTSLLHVNVIQRVGPALGAWSNFLLALNELYHREPRADAYLMVQDDAVYCRGLKKYLEQSLWPGPTPGVVSLHTPRHLAAATGTGFYPADLGWGAWGAQAFIFSNSAVRAFLSDSQVMDHRLKGVLEGKKNVDSVVGDWCRRTKREFWLHAPSLCEHIGAKSTLWRKGELKGRRTSADFPGETKLLDRSLAARRKSHGIQPPPAIRLLNDGRVEFVDPPPKDGRDGVLGLKGAAAAPREIKAGTNTKLPETNLSMAKPERKLLGLIILTHEAYERYLANILDCVQEHRALLDEVVLVLNGNIDLPSPPPWLRVVQGHWDSPQAARNAGLAAAQCEWMCYLDGDNLPTDGFFRAMRASAKDAPASAAVLYPGTVLRVTEETEAQRVFVMPEWNEFEGREKSIVDTSSAWRVAALRSVGGWFTPSKLLDDYVTVLQLLHQGWNGERVPEAVAVLRHHQGRRNRAVEAIPETLWHARRHLLLTLFAGRRHSLSRLLDWYRQAELPPQTAIHWVDNSGDAKFHGRLWRAAEALSSQARVSRVTITREHHRPSTATFEVVHSHIASLYNNALHSVSADVVITIEDDVIPPVDALRPLVGPLQPWSAVAGVAAVYPSRHDPSVANVALETLQWSRMPKLEALPSASVIPVGMIAGGCTAWHAPALLRMLPLQVSPRLGWDGNLSARLNHAGYRLLLATDVRCAHLTGGRRSPAKVRTIETAPSLSADTGCKNQTQINERKTI